MKITIDCSIKKITKVEQSPIYFGNNNVDKIVLSFINTSSISLDWYPSLSAVGPDKNPIYPRSYDTDGITSANGITNYDFTLSNSNGWNLIAGKHLFYVWMNYPDTNGNECVGSFACTIIASSVYYMIDNLVVNPQLRQYLENSFEEHYNDVDARFEELQEDFNDEYTEEVNAQRSLINNLIGGQPRYVNTSSNILALTTNQGVAASTDTQKWYYWNGTQYVEGGDYPGVAGYDELKVSYTNVNDNVGDINNVLFDVNNNVPVSSIENNKKILDSGFGQYNTSYKVVKYPITAGNLYYVNTSDYWQFQSGDSVPNSSGTLLRIGTTHFGNGYAIAPSGTTYLVVSIPTANSPIVRYRSSLSTKYDESINMLSNLVDSKSYTYYGTWVSGKIIDYYGKYSNFDGYSACENFIKVPDWAELVINYQNVVGYIGYYNDSNDSAFIKRNKVEYTATGKSYTITSSDAKYIRLAVYSTDSSLLNNIVVKYKYKLNEDISELKDFKDSFGIIKSSFTATYNTTLFDLNDVSIGDTITVEFDTQDGHEGYVELLDSSNTRIKYYGIPNQNSANNYKTSFVIPSNFNKCRVGSATSINIHFVRKQNDVEKLEKKIMSENKITNAVRKPVITFIDDDGNPAFITHILPTAQSYGYPYCCAYIRDANPSIRMTTAQLKQIVSAGGEILGHNTSPLTSMTFEQAEESVKDVKDFMNSIGFDLKGYCYPYGSSNENIRSMIQKYYDFAFITNVQTNVTPLNKKMIANYHILRVNVAGHYETNLSGQYAGYNSSSIEFFRKVIDDCIENNAWLVFTSHCLEMTDGHKLSPWQDIDQVQLLNDVMAYIKNKQDAGSNVEVLTASEGFKIHGNAIQCGDYLGEFNNDMTLHTNKGSAIGKDGKYDFPVNNLVSWD